MSSILPERTQPSGGPETHAPSDAGDGRAARKLSRAWQKDVLRRRMLAGADAVAIVATGWAFGFTSGSGLKFFGFLCLVAMVGVAAAKLLGLYDRDHRLLWHTTGEELHRIAMWAAVLTTALVVLLRASGDPVPGAVEMVGFAFAAMTADAGLRGAARSLWRQLTPPERIVILGSGPVEEAVRRKFEIFADLHVELLACPSELRGLSADGATTPAALLAGLGVGPSSVDRVLVAAAAPDESLIASLVPYCRSHEIKLGFVPPARGMFGTAVQLDHVAELPIVQYNTWDVSRTTLLGKRMLDGLLSATMLVMFAPSLVLIAAAVKLDSRGPVLFRQRRAGQNGRPFTMLKFRSMSRDAEERLSEVVRLDSLADPMFKLRHDPRVTRVGRVLRRASLDELPQLWNVLCGRMSLVGPRPEELALVDRYPPEIRSVRLAVKPGLTGPMQVFGRGALTFEERVAVEREYIENLSLQRDVCILAMTLSAVGRGRGAF